MKPCRFCRDEAISAYVLGKVARVPFCLYHLRILYFGLSLRTNWAD